MNDVPPRFTILSVHGHHIEDGRIGLPRPGRPPWPEWTVLDRAYNAKPVARFSTATGEEKAKALCEALNEENELSIRTPGYYQPRFQEIIDAATHTDKGGRMRRNKGLRGEREVKLAFVNAGYLARKLEDQGDHVVYDHPLGILHVEAKRQEMCEIHKWMRQAEREAAPGAIPTVVFRRSRERWYVCLPLDDFLGNGQR